MKFIQHLLSKSYHFTFHHSNRLPNCDTVSWNIFIYGQVYTNYSSITNHHSRQYNYSFTNPNIFADMNRWDDAFPMVAMSGGESLLEPL